MAGCTSTIGSVPALPACPGIATFRARVIRRLGHDPFAAGGRRRLEVRLAAGGAKDTVTLTLRDAGGQVTGVRRLTASRCDDLVRVAALAVAIALAAPAGTGSRSPPAPAPTTRRPAAAVPPPAVPPPALGPPVPAARAPVPTAPRLAQRPPAPAAAPWLRLLGFVAVAGDTGTLPTPVPSVVAGGGVALGAASVWLSVGADLPATVSVAGGAVVAWDARATLRACVGAGPLGLCLLGRGGVLRLGGWGLEAARTADLPLATVGLGGHFDRRLSRHLALRLFADIDVALLRPVAVDSVTGAHLWVAPPVSVTLGLGVVVSP